MGAFGGSGHDRVLFYPQASLAYPQASLAPDEGLQSHM
jgi:hypothetical protein